MSRVTHSYYACVIQQTANFTYAYSSPVVLTAVAATRFRNTERDAATLVSANSGISQQWYRHARNEGRRGVPVCEAPIADHFLVVPSRNRVKPSSVTLHARTCARKPGTRSVVVMPRTCMRTCPRNHTQLHLRFATRVEIFQSSATRGRRRVSRQDHGGVEQTPFR